MWSFFCLTVVFVAKADLIPCQNQVTYLNETWSSWHLLPPGNFSLDTACSYTFVYPNDTALCGQFYPGEQWRPDSWYDGAIGGVDAFGAVANLISYRVMMCLPPPWYSVFLPAKERAEMHFSSMDSCTANNCRQYRLMKVDAFTNNKTVAVTPGMKPFIILENNSTQRITYNFTGNLSAVYVKGVNLYTYEMTALGAESFFLYNEMGQIIGTPASWQSSVQQFSQLIVHEMPPGTPGPYADPSGLVLVMPTEDLDGLVYPKFIQPSYQTVPTVDASHGETSVTIVDADSYSNYCVQYQLGLFTFTEDVDIIIHDGFPNKGSVYTKFHFPRRDATTLDPDYVAILGCTKTLRVLQGAVSFYITTMNSYLIRNDTIKGFIKPEPKALKKLQKQRVTLDLTGQNRKQCNYTGEINWENGSPTDSKLLLNTYDPETHQRVAIFPPNSSEFESLDQYYLSFELNKGAIHFDIKVTGPE